MRYGTECEPVFRHGIPDGWRERWRLIREFTERWHRIPMNDVGDRQTDIDRMESRFGRKFPPAVREWIAFGLEMQWHQDYPGEFRRMYLEDVPGNAAFSLWYCEGEEVGAFDDYHLAVRFSDLHEPDPPLCGFRQATGEDHNYGFVLDEHRPPIGTVTAFAIDQVLASAHSEDGFAIEVEHLPDLRRDLNRSFPHCIKWGNSEWYETDTISLRIGPSSRWRGREAHLLLKVSQPNPLDHIPGFLWRYARLGHAWSGLFKGMKLK
jgi:hypothetical protein